jgi:hypothetical protein
MVLHIQHPQQSCGMLAAGLAITAEHKVLELQRHTSGNSPLQQQQQQQQ